jgi:hypothetical protein
MARPNETLTVKRESLPVRCEVCHQTDKFNPATGVCRRCNEAFDEPVGLMPWFAIGHWNVPEAFHEEFLEAAKREQVLWVGRPVKNVDWWIGSKIPIGITYSVYAVLLGIMLFLGWAMGEDDRMSVPFIYFLVFMSIVVGLFQMFVLLTARFRLGQTLYVLTNRRALVVYADQIMPTKEYVIRHETLRRVTTDKRDDVGHLIFEERKTPFEHELGPAWDQPVRAIHAFRTIYPRGFFFIENVSEVEQLIHEHVPRRVVESHE